MEKKFTNNWFGNNIKSWEKYVLPRVRDGASILEIGSYEGNSTCWMLDNIKDSMITCVDTFGGGIEHSKEEIDNLFERFLNNISEYPIDRINILVGESSDITRGFRINEFDMVYVDGSHQAKDVLTDIVQSWFSLKSGGLMVMDDYEWICDGDVPHLQPRIAIDAFLNCFADQFIYLDVGYQVIIQKV